MNISPLAVVHPEAQIGQNVTIDPFAVIEKDVVIGDNCHIRLQQQLRDVRFEALSISSELTGNSRQSQIELLIEEQGIELETAKNPPYELYK